MAVEDRNNSSILYRNVRSKLHNNIKPKKRSNDPTNSHYFSQIDMQEAKRRFNFGLCVQNWNYMSQLGVKYGNISLKKEKIYDEFNRHKAETKLKSRKAENLRIEKLHISYEERNKENGWGLPFINGPTTNNNQNNTQSELTPTGIIELSENKETDIDEH